MIGERIRQARIAAGMSQADLGTAAGIPQQQVQRYEQQDRIWVDRLLIIAKVTRQPIAFFVDEIAEQAAGLSPEEQELVAEWRALSDPEERQRFRSALQLDAEGQRLVEVFAGIDDAGRRSLRAEAEKLWVLNRRDEGTKP